MKKVIAAVVFMLLVAVFAPFGASDVAFANDGKTMPPQNLSVIVRDGNYYLTFENVPGNNGYEVVVNGTTNVVEKDVTTVPINVERQRIFGKDKDDLRRRNAHVRLLRNHARYRSRAFRARKTYDVRRQETVVFRG